MRIFYLFTCLVLLWGYEQWSRLPWGLHVAVFGNVLVALGLTVWQTYRLGSGGTSEEGVSVAERETEEER